MASADGGELVVLAPALKEFGEDPQIDKLIRQYGYRGTPAIPPSASGPTATSSPADRGHLACLAKAARRTWQPSTTASSVMHRGGATFTVAPPNPTGANISRPLR